MKTITDKRRMMGAKFPIQARKGRITASTIATSLGFQRHRQIEKGWTPEHDDARRSGKWFKPKETS